MTVNAEILAKSLPSLESVTPTHPGVFLLPRWLLLQSPDILVQGKQDVFANLSIVSRQHLDHPPIHSWISRSSSCQMTPSIFLAAFIMVNTNASPLMIRLTFEIGLVCRYSLGKAGSRCLVLDSSTSYEPIDDRHLRQSQLYQRFSVPAVLRRQRSRCESLHCTPLS